MQRTLTKGLVRTLAVVVVWMALAVTGEVLGFNTIPGHWGGLTPSDVAAIHDHSSHHHDAELIDGHHVKTAPPTANTQAMSNVPCTLGFAGPFPCQNVDLLAFLPTNSLSGGGTGADIWGWTDPASGREFAVQTHSMAVSFVEVTDPTLPIYVGSMPTALTDSGANVLWRDAKVYANHAFVVGDGDFGPPEHGLEIFDLTQLLSATPGTVFLETAHYDGFRNGHNFVINEDSGIGYAVGTNTCAGGLHVLDLAVPTDPQPLGCVDEDGYTHDAQCVIYSGPDADHQGREICLNSNEDTLTIFDVTPLIEGTGPAVMLSRETYDGFGYTHQGWLTEDQSRFVLGDETDEMDALTGGDPHNTFSYVWDVADLDAPVLISTYVGPSAAIDHNIYIKDGFVYEANYTEGLRILDASNIEAGELTQVAYFDTHPADDATTFAGSWSSYPYFDSGTIVVSNIEDGLFVLRARLPGTKPPVEPSGGGKVTGGGWLATDGKKLNFGFNAESTETGFDGHLTLIDKSVGVKVRLDTVTALGELTESCGAIEPGPNALEFHGTGTFNGDAATFRVCAEDNGEGNAADRFVLSCLQGCDYHTSSRALDDELDGGNIQLHDDGGSSESASVLILDPMLTTEGMVGAAQVLHVSAFDAQGELLPGAAIRLIVVDTTGQSTLLDGLTDTGGIAVFTVTLSGGDTEYVATAGNLSSNAVDITGLG